MSLSLLNRPTLRTALTMALVIAAGACSDQSITSSATPVPVPPAVNANQAGMLRGTVREDGSVVLESLDPSIQVGDSNVSGAIYGNQNVTAKVTTSNFLLTNNGTTKTWTFKLAVHNLLPYAVGSVDGVSSAPYDTVGMFVFFPSAPTVVSPTACGCAVSVLNTQGMGNFTAPNQLYYWYHDLLATKGVVGRDSTTSIPTWTFTAPSKVNSFRFFVILSSPWPRGLQTQDTAWSVSYNPTADSIPDVSASPRWKRIGLNYGGTNSSASSGLTMNVSHSSRGGPDDMFFYRSDNLNRTENAYIESRLSLPTSGGSKPVMILALADSVKFVGLGIGNGKIGFATFNQSTFTWEWTAGATLAMTTTSAHTYRVGKFGATTATVYVDGVEKFSSANSLLPDNFMPTYSLFVGAQAAHLSTFFGPTAQDADAKVVVSYVNYAIHATPKP
ncbi:MAG: Regulator of chromosome condensation repeat-containing protein [Gemmatimonadetes bacterium]|jgi:hypothetical protein|nr:Regulator of chromosome condensation repeat-containing protein [Gemmatimonadota bacterium]